MLSVKSDPNKQLSETDDTFAVTTANDEVLPPVCPRRRSTSISSFKAELCQAASDGCIDDVIDIYPLVSDGMRALSEALNEALKNRHWAVVRLL